MTSDLPKIDLATFFLSISSAAYMGLGIAPGPQSGKAQMDLAMARQNIDLLELMYEKTKGNRTPEEERLIEQLLFEIRIKYLEKKREVERSTGGQVQV